MNLENTVNSIQVQIKRGIFITEADVSQGVLLRVLNELGWPVFNTSVVIPQYSIEGRRVDFALCQPVNKPIVFVEVKKAGNLEGADRQLFEYAFHIGVPMAVLTDGQQWSFYLPGEQGRYDERRVYKLDLLERSPEEASARLVRYLEYDRICSGEALSAARADYQNVSRDREIEITLPKAWHSILEDADSLLIDLLSEKVESLCGYKPDLDDCSRFIKRILTNSTAEGAVTVIPSPHIVTHSNQKNNASSTNISSRTSDNFSFIYKSRSYKVKSARDVMTKIFKLLALDDKGFLERFASRKHGKKRRYLAKSKSDLYPGRTDLGEQHSVEIVPGWWLGTNYSRRNIQVIIDLAIEVADPAIGATIYAKVDS